MVATGENPNKSADKSAEPPGQDPSRESPISTLQSERQGSPAQASASSTDCVQMSVTRPARRSTSSSHMWCLEQGSSPTIGSSKSSTCKVRASVMHTSHCVGRLCSVLVVLSPNRTQCVLKCWPFFIELSIFLPFLCEYDYHFHLKYSSHSPGFLISSGSQVSQAFRAQGQRNTDVCIPKLCLWKDWCLPGDPLKLQLQERVFFFVPHSESQRGHPEGR